MFAHESLGAEELGLDRVDGDAASLGDLAVRELFDVTEDQDHPGLRGKLAQGAVDVDPLCAGEACRAGTSVGPATSPSRRRLRHWSTQMFVRIR